MSDQPAVRRGRRKRRGNVFISRLGKGKNSVFSNSIPSRRLDFVTVKVRYITIRDHLWALYSTLGICNDTHRVADKAIRVLWLEGRSERGKKFDVFIIKILFWCPLQVFSIALPCTCLIYQCAESWSLIFLWCRRRRPNFHHRECLP